ncbi:MAG: Verru Chthon cassette protein [Verrucomicrobiaceae bacterium]|nr:Verru Chthon cassette protein [Verrucomicrobiaceae bacterium]
MTSHPQEPRSCVILPQGRPPQAPLVKDACGNGRKAPRPRGFALVSVLGLTVLLTLIVVGLLATSGQQFKTENSALEFSRARWTGQNAVSIALGQLVSATSQQFPDGTPKPWTSQPGGIRVHAMDGSLEKLHKLYSAAQMEVTSLDDIQSDLPDDWQQRTEEFVDLNVPTESVDGSLSFPIVDPRAKTTSPLTSVEGFDYTAAAGAVGPETGAAAQRLPMPVRWIYQRRNGSLAVIGPDGNFTPSTTVPSNPVVSRFAYWVDDESCKVNINTASEGAFWDTPRADTKQERALAVKQPTRREYQRQPGHPAGVCLSSVFLPGRRLYPANFEPVGTTGMVPMSLDDARNLWRLGRLAVADLGTGTSWGGTATPDWPSLWDSQPKTLVRQPPYTNVDELLFDNVDANNFPKLWEFGGSGSRHVHKFFEAHPEAMARQASAGFFLTAQSTAPEVTLYGTPRIAMWPVDAATLLNGATLGSGQILRDTSYSHKVAMAGVLKNRPYFVQRSESGDGGNDMSVNAEGANKVLLNYLHRLTDLPVPGFSRPAQGFTTFADKYGDDRDAILLQMFDYIRSTSLADGQLEATKQFTVLCVGAEHQGFGQVSPMLKDRLVASTAGINDQPQGQGRMMTVSEVALIVVCTAEVQPNGQIKGTCLPANRPALAHPGDRELQAGFLVKSFVPGEGWTDYRPYTSIALVGGGPGTAPSLKAEMPKLRLNGKDLVIANNGKSVTMQAPDLPPASWKGAGGAIGVRSLSDGVIAFDPIVVPAGPPGQEQQMELEGASGDANQLKLAVYNTPSSAVSGNKADAVHLLHVIPLVLPDIKADSSGGVPLPSLPADGVQYTLAGRMKDACRSAGATLISPNDVVQSLAPVHGDYRLIAAQRWAASSSGGVVFVPHPKWGRQRFAHTLRDAALAVGSGTEGYIKSLSYAPGFRPDMPSTLVDATTTITEATFNLWKSGAWTPSPIDGLRLDHGTRGAALPQATGDFDNGLANAPDGPYINRADDGHWAAVHDPSKVPYFDNVSQTLETVPPVTLAAFSAQRTLPSPVMFGSLPTGTRAQVPWQTLLFRPQPDHYGAHTPPDHVLLDMFWSPVLEPEPPKGAFETAGKINLNHELLPFRHIKRATALHAAMKAETMMAIPNTAASTYKSGEQPEARFRSYIDAAATLKSWQAGVFDQGKVFLTASQICEQPLVPEGLVPNGQIPTREILEAFWQDHKLTGDNTKERPYAHLYSRLTTRSNTFRVHFIAQALQKARSTPPEKFIAGRDLVTAFTRGSSLLSRRLNIDDPAIPDYQAVPVAGSAPVKPLDAFYRWHRE